jgi:hypothetical protein
MRAGLVLGLVALGGVAVSALAASAPAEAKGRRGTVFVARSHDAPSHTPVEPPRVQTAAVEAGGPEPMTTGTTAPVTRREAAPAPAPVPAKPWCTGRVFGSGAGFCAIN